MLGRVPSLDPWHLTISHKTIFQIGIFIIILILSLFHYGLLDMCVCSGAVNIICLVCNLLDHEELHPFLIVRIPPCSDPRPWGGCTNSMRMIWIVSLGRAECALWVKWERMDIWELDVSNLELTSSSSQKSVYSFFTGTCLHSVFDPPYRPMWPCDGAPVN